MWQGLAYVAAETTTATNMGILGATVPLSFHGQVRLGVIQLLVPQVPN